MIVAEDEENDEKAQALRRKLIKNVVEAKLKNEREKERLGHTLGNLAKEEQREMRNIQRNLVSLRRELKAMEPGKTSENGLSVKSAVLTHVADNGDFLINKEKPRQERLYQRRHSEFVTRSPMSYLELKRLPPLQATEQGLVVWPLPYKQEKTAEFPASLKHRKSLALPKIQLPQNHDMARRRARLHSSPAILNVLQCEQGINRPESLKQDTSSSHEHDDDE